MLSPGGLLNVSFFPKDHIFSKDPTKKGEVRLLSKADVIDMVQQAGFTNVHAEVLTHITPTSFDPKTEWKLIHVDAEKPALDSVSRESAEGRRVKNVLRESLP